MVAVRVARHVTAAVAALGICLTINAAFADSGLTIVTEDYPPLNYIEDGKLKGPSVEIVKLIKGRLGIESEIEVYPWARGYKYLETRDNVVLFSTARTKAREKLFKWVGPIAEKRIGMFARRDRNIRLESLPEAKPYLIGVQRGSVTMQYLDQHGLKNYDAASNATGNLRKLMAGRNDLWFSSNSTVVGTCKRLKVDVNELELVLEVEKTSIYIAFSRQVPDAEIARWQSAYDALVREGIIEKIFRKYDQTSMRPSVSGK